MGFFQDLKQDLSQTVDGMEDEALNLTDAAADAEPVATEDLFGQTGGEDFADLEAMLEKEVSALGDAGSNEETAAPEESAAPAVEEETSTDNEVEALLNEVEQNITEQAPAMEEAPKAAEPSFFNAQEAVSTDTAVITAGMNITGDVTSTGNMDLIGTIKGNIEINGKLNVTGSINGNSSAAEIYAESAQINGEVKSKGSVKIGQSSVVIGNIYATSAVIAGAVKGDIDVHGPVILDTSAIVMGNIKSKSVQINNGAVIEGMCSQCYAEVSPTSFFNDVKKNRK